MRRIFTSYGEFRYCWKNKGCLKKNHIMLKLCRSLLKNVWILTLGLGTWRRGLWLLCDRNQANQSQAGKQKEEVGQEAALLQERSSSIDNNDRTLQVVLAWTVLALFFFAKKIWIIQLVTFIYQLKCLFLNFWIVVSFDWAVRTYIFRPICN